MKQSQDSQTSFTLRLILCPPRPWCICGFCSEAPHALLWTPSGCLRPVVQWSPHLLTAHAPRFIQDFSLSLAATQRPFWSVAFSFNPFILSPKDGGDDANRVSRAECSEQSCAHVGQSELRVEAAGRCAVWASQIPLQVRNTHTVCWHSRAFI